MDRRQIIRASAVGVIMPNIAGCMDLEERFNEGEQDLEDRIEDVNPADSFEVMIGHSESNAVLWFQAEDIDTVDISETAGQTQLLMSFTEEQADQIQRSAVDFGDDLPEVTVFSYLDGELIHGAGVSQHLAEDMLDGYWADDPRITLQMAEEDMERIAATVLEYSEN